MIKTNSQKTRAASFGILSTWIFASFFQLAHAVPWSNQFVEFDLPGQWSCTLEGAEWVCQSADKDKKRDAIIILAAKLKGDQDSLDQYEAYLKQPKRYTSVQGKPVQSEPKSTKQTQIAQQPWIDALHLESEIPGFYTRYLATVIQDIAVLVTYSINKDKYNEYQADFEALTKTIRVFRKPGAGLNMAPKEGNLINSITVPTSITQGTVFAPAKEENTDTTPRTAQKQQDDSTLLIVLLVAVVGFIIWRRRRS